MGVTEELSFRIDILIRYYLDHDIKKYIWHWWIINIGILFTSRKSELTPFNNKNIELFFILYRLGTYIRNFPYELEDLRVVNKKFTKL